MQSLWCDTHPAHTHTPCTRTHTHTLHTYTRTPAPAHLHMRSHKGLRVCLFANFCSPTCLVSLCPTALLRSLLPSHPLTNLYSSYYGVLSSDNHMLAYPYSPPHVQGRLLVFQRGEAHCQPSSYKLSIYLYVNSALRSFSRKCSVTLSYQLAVFPCDLTCVLSMASRARLLKRPWPMGSRV